MEFDKAIRMRQSVRKYTDRHVTREALDQIVEAGQAAPFAMGDDKTTMIIVVDSPQAVAKIKEAGMLKRKDGTLMDPFYGAQTLIFVAAGELSDDHIEYCNVACIIENMLLKAADLGLGSTYIWGCLRKIKANEEAMGLLDLPEGYEVLSAMAVGHPAVELKERKARNSFAYKYI